MIQGKKINIYTLLYLSQHVPCRYDLLARGNSNSVTRRFSGVGVCPSFFETGWLDDIDTRSCPQSACPDF
jgi:hypothetical protein